MGTLITLTLFNPKKTALALRIDLTLVAVIQLLALVYGLWTVSVARPVRLVFEEDRFRVVHAVDIPQGRLKHVLPGVNPLPLTGPTLLGVRPFRDSNEQLEVTLSALQGLQPAFRPDLWQPYASSVNQVLKAAKPVNELKARFAKNAADMDAILSKAGRDSASVVYLPLIGRKDAWTVFLDPVSAEVIAAMPLDSF